MIRTILFSALFFIATPFMAEAQHWVLKDIGVGLLVMDAEYDKTLKVAQRSTNWNMDELYASGAFSGRYDGTKALAAWIQGPPVDSFKNANGIPVWMYKYKITYPDGSTFEAGPHGFYSPGFAFVALDYGKKGANKYKVDFYIWHRDTRETKHAGTVEFIASYNN